ncbi:DapH/DapD/GlmU-related protein [Methyloversatilis sp.]|uniref:acyltransferase n=1 Tax=Methyloversatilis sp. TaxID=2569862 RepID=UPI0035B22D8D
MRKISVLQILVFNLLLLLCFGLTWGLYKLAVAPWIYAATAEYRPLATVLLFAVLFFCVSVCVHRLFLALFPLRPGEVAQGSGQEFVYHVYILFYLLVFYPVLRSGIPPAPIMRLLYQALGAKLGGNTYSQGLIHDPMFVTIGENSTVGQSALIIPHQIEGNKLAHLPITMGNHVTIGANAVILPGVRIGNHAMVATGAVVPKETVIGDHEVWGGVPAKRIR